MGHLATEGAARSLLSKKRSKKELTKRPPFLVKSLVWKSSEKTVNGGWRDGQDTRAFLANCFYWSTGTNLRAESKSAVQKKLPKASAAGANLLR